MSSPTSTRNTSRRRKPFGDHVAATVAGLQYGYLKSLPGAVAIMARLRTAIGAPVGSVFDILEITAVEPQFLPGRLGDEPSAVELAKHAALTLYAVHQQSYRERGLHVDGRGFGQAIRALSQAGPSAEAVQRRFAALGTASTLTEALYHARGLVRQLRDERIPMDYGLLADDLVAFQRPGGSARVRSLWGREYYRTIPVVKNPEEEA